MARDAPARGMAPEPGRPPPNLARSVGTGENVFVSWLICGPTCSEWVGRSQLECLLCGTQSTSLVVGGPRRRGRRQGRGATEPRRHPLTSAIRKTGLLPALGLGRRAEAMVVSRRWCLLFDMVVGGLRGFFARPSSTRPQRRGG